MLNFTVKFPASRPSPVGWSQQVAARPGVRGKELLKFAVTGSKVLFAGSRHKDLDPRFCAGLLSAFSSRGAHFLTGCAKGVDLSFRRALAEGAYHDRSFIACAFNRAAGKMDLPANKVVPDGLRPAVALAKRTVWMCGEASLLILFPSEPIGPGSRLAFQSMIQANKPVFLAQETEPEASPDYDVYPSVLFNLVRGWWILPRVYPGLDTHTNHKQKRHIQTTEDKPKKTTGQVTSSIPSAGSDPVGVL